MVEHTTENRGVAGSNPALATFSSAAPTLSFPSMPFRRLSLLSLLAAAVVAPFAPGASACGCGEFRGVVVAHGSSLYGAPWRIKAVVPRDSGPDQAMFEFSVGKSPDGGYFSSLPRPVPKALVLTASPGSEIDEFPESDVSGITAGQVTRLEVEMDDGHVLETEPLRAPARFRNRFHWLRALRFYDVFFPDSEEPVQVTALDAQGHVLERLDWKH